WCGTLLMLVPPSSVLYCSYGLFFHIGFAGHASSGTRFFFCARLLMPPPAPSDPLPGAGGSPEANSPAHHSPLRVLAYREYRLLWSGQFLSMIGSRMQGAAILWQVFDLTHSPLALGAIGLVRAAALMSFALVGGVLADAIDRRRLMLITQSILALLPQPATARGTMPRINFHAAIEGLRFMRSSRLLLSLMILDFLATFFSSADTLLPMFARQVLHIGPQQYGLLASAPAMGALL